MEVLGTPLESDEMYRRERGWAPDWSAAEGAIRA
jgi:hypothetical protein